MSLKQQLLHHFMQIPGWRTPRKIVVIESDDWGSVRMPSLDVYHELLQQGIRVDRCPFSRYDSLERGVDLEVLFEVLKSVRDKNGCPAVITADCVVANPDFDRIEKDHYARYYYEIITETFKKYKGCENSYALYAQGIHERVWHPQFHGREHLNVHRWMEALRQKDEITCLAFHQEHFGLSDKVSPKLKVRYMDAFGNSGEETFQEEIQILREGTDLFEQLFGYRSTSFITPCYTWRKELEPELFKLGVRYLQGLSFQQVPVNDKPLILKSVYRYMGERNRVGQRYLIRNVFFEPYKGKSVDWVDDCMGRISIAFRWHKPAIISTHRLNFIGSLDVVHRDQNLNLLRELLQAIVRQWPDVEFLTSDQLGDLIALE